MIFFVDTKFSIFVLLKLSMVLQTNFFYKRKIEDCWDLCFVLRSLTGSILRFFKNSNNIHTFVESTYEAS